jgi:hypothetical protein
MQGMQSMGGMSNMRGGPQGMQGMMSGNRMFAPPMSNQLATGTQSAAAQQQAARDAQWQQYTRAVGMHPANQRWLQQLSAR